MKKAAGLLLSKLLDKYENSSLYKGTTPSNRRIWLHFNRRNLPGYFDDTTARHKENINEAACYLEDLRYIDIIWERFEEGNLIKKIALNTEHLEAAYKFMGRGPKQDKESRVAGLARYYARGAVPWVGEFLQYVADRVDRGDSVARYLDIENPDHADMLFKAVKEAGLLEEEIPRRVFSQRVLRSTKAFNAVAGAVARVAADFHPRFAGEETAVKPGEILAELGIVDNPQHIFISGGLQFTVGNNLIDVSNFQPDLGIPTEMVRQMQIIAVSVEYIITIENLTSFYNFVKANNGKYLAVYLGGYHNSLRRNFLQKVKDFIDVTGQKIPFFHWGDIDYGGFDIYVHLRDNCLPELTPAFMDLETLKKYTDYCIGFNEKYTGRLHQLLKNQKYRDFHPVINYMLEKSIRLEQECVEPDIQSLIEGIK